MRAPAAAVGAALSGLLSASLLGTASAHVGECSASTDEAFDYQVSVTTDLTIYWTVDTVNEEITLQAVYEGDAWVGIGFSESGGMLGSDAVIALPDEGTALEYYLAGYDLAGVTEASVPEISGAAVTQAESTTTLIFTRPLSPSDSANKNAISPEEGVEATFIWAYGADNALDRHGSRGDVTVGDLFCTGGSAESPRGRGGVGDGAGDAAVSAGSCESSEPDYDFEVSPSRGLALLWRVMDGGTAVSVKAVYQGEGWLSIGFSERGAMAGSDAVIGLPASLTALEYDMDDYNQPDVAIEQEITEASITQADGVTTLTFVRPLEPEGDGKQVLHATGEFIWLFAWGGSNDFVEHVAEGAFVLSLDSCSIRGAGEGGTRSEYAHAWLMVIGWSICFPAGVIFARFSKSFAKLGFPAHRVLQTLGALLGLAGFIVAIIFTEDTGSDHFDNTHGMLGLVMTGLVVVQVLYADFRPPAEVPETAPYETRQAVQETVPVTCMRRAWSYSHRLVGCLLLILAVYQCLTGIHLLGVKDIWRTLYVALTALTAGVFLLLQLAACCSWGCCCCRRDTKTVHGRVVTQLPFSPVTNTTTGTSY